MSKKLLCIFTCLALLLSGCIYRSSAGEQPTAIVYRSSGSDTGGRLVRETVGLSEGQEPFSAIVDALNRAPAVAGLGSTFPRNVEIESCTLDGGTATVEMSREYFELEGIEKLLAESSIVLSLGTVNEVCAVDICCLGTYVGSGLTPEAYDEADGLCGSYERTLKLYMPGNGMLVPKSVGAYDDGSAGSAELVLTELLQALGGGMENTGIVSAEIENGLCSVELSGEFFGAEPTEKTEGMLIIYSIVNSLCRLPAIEAVSISVEGAELESYGGFRCSWPLGPNKNLISH